MQKQFYVLVGAPNSLPPFDGPKGPSVDKVI